MTFTLTGLVRLPDGTTAHQGTARVTTLAPIKDLAGNVVMTGSVQQALSSGAFSFVLPDDSLADAYRLDVITASGALLDPITFAPGAPSTTLDLSDMVSTDVLVAVPDTATAATTTALTAETNARTAADTAETNARTAADAAHVAAGNPHTQYLQTSAAPALITSTVLHYSGSGFPEGVVTATVGARYIDTAATNGAVQWTKVSGSGNTGWKVVYGDTGWRRVVVWDAAGNITTGSLPAGWVPRTGQAGDIRARRFNDRVEVVVTQIQVAVDATSDWMWTASTGFAPTAVSTSGGVVVPSASPSGGWCIKPNLARVSNNGLTVGSFSPGMNLSYPTDDAWPSTLPGIAG